MSEAKKIVPLRPEQLDDSRPVYTLTIGELRGVIRQEVQISPSPSAAPDKWLDAKTAAELLGVSEEWLYHHTKKLPFARKIGPKMLRFSLSGLQEWMESKKI